MTRETHGICAMPDCEVCPGTGGIVSGQPDIVYQCGQLHVHASQLLAQNCDRTYEARQTGQPEPVNLRRKCLETALQYTMKDRNAAHGNPESNFANIAMYWNAHLRARYPDAHIMIELDATDVTLMMAGMKLARLSHNPAHEDSWIDLAGYAACGMDVALGGDDSSVESA